MSLGGGMVDTRDLKSLGPKGLYGFESRPRHNKTLYIADYQAFIKSCHFITGVFDSPFFREEYDLR